MAPKKRRFRKVWARPPKTKNGQEACRVIIRRARGGRREGRKRASLGARKRAVRGKQRAGRESGSSSPGGSRQEGEKYPKP